MRLEDLRQLIESTLMSMDFSSKLDEDEFGLISSGLSIYLEDLNPRQRHEAFPYFNIQNFGKSFSNSVHIFFVPFW